MTGNAILRLATRSVRRTPIRSAFTGLGLLLGVLAVTLTEASGEGARRAVDKQWKAMVGNMDALFVSPGGPAQRGMASMENSIATLTQDDASAIATGVPNVRAVGPEQDAFTAAVEAGGRNGTTSLLGVTPNWVELRGDAMAEGAMFDEAQNRAVSRVAVLGADVAHDYFPGVSPIGRRIRVAGVDLQIVGVTAPNGAGPGGGSIDNLVLVPLQTAARRIFNRSHVNSIRVQLTDASRSDETQAAVTALLRARHQLASGQIDDFRISSPRAMLARQRYVDSSLQTTIFWAGVLALILGGVMVANLMYAGTADRTPEIGIRRALGATRRDIRLQFWTEAVAVSSLAGVLGAALSLAAIGVGGALLGYPLAVSWPVTALAVGATIVIGLIAGFLPAQRAASIPPVEALRRST